MVATYPEPHPLFASLKQIADNAIPINIVHAEKQPNIAL
jgi:hypothetical protein